MPGRLVHPGYYEKIYLCVMKTLRHDQDWLSPFEDSYSVAINYE